MTEVGLRWRIQRRVHSRDDAAVAEHYRGDYHVRRDSAVADPEWLHACGRIARLQNGTITAFRSRSAPPTVTCLVPVFAMQAPIALALLLLLGCGDTTARGQRRLPVWTTPLTTSDAVGGAENSVHGADSSLVEFSTSSAEVAAGVALDAFTGSNSWKRTLSDRSATEFSMSAVTSSAIIRSTPTRLTELERSDAFRWDSSFSGQGGRRFRLSEQVR